MVIYAEYVHNLINQHNFPLSGPFHPNSTNFARKLSNSRHFPVYKLSGHVYEIYGCIHILGVNNAK